MESLKTKIDDLMYILKTENPNANWKNLITGITILVLVAVFSIWYFDSTPSDTSLIDSLRRGNRLQVNEDFTTNGKGTSSILSGSDVTNDEYITVQKGEGLWHVAKRVCGDGEKYKYIADANNLHIHYARLAVGQKLKVACGE